MLLGEDGKPGKGAAGDWSFSAMNEWIMNENSLESVCKSTIHSFDLSNLPFCENLYQYLVDSIVLRKTGDFVDN